MRSRVPAWLRVACLTGIVAMVGSLVVRDAYLDAAEHAREEEFAATAELLAGTIQSSLDTIESQTAAIAGLMMASQEVDDEEFGRFVAMNDQTLGVAGWGVVELRPDGAMPVVLFEPAESIRWLDWSDADLARERSTRAVVSTSLRTGQPGLSRFMAFESGALGAVLVVPAPADAGRELAALATIDIEEFEALASRSAGTMATVRLSESTITPTDGGFVPGAGVGLAGKRWSLVIEPVDASPPTSPAASLVIVAAVTILAGTLAAAVVRRRELQMSLERTRALNQARDEFLGVISHEIRTPLTAVVGFAGELRSEWRHLSETERDDMLRLVDEQGQEVAAIVSDLLVVGRADIHSLHIHAGPVPVEDVVRLALESAPRQDRMGAVEMRCAGTVLADRGRLSQVIRNLVVNAVRYGGPHVMVETRHRPGFVDIVVSDDGEGVPEEFAVAVFERYFALARESESLPSIGLGLYVSRRLTEVMGGSLTYERSEGRTRFVASVPAWDPEPPADAAGTPQNTGSHAV